jgi:hypothetical protein
MKTTQEERDRWRRLLENNEPGSSIRRRTALLDDADELARIRAGLERLCENIGLNEPEQDDVLLDIQALLDGTP